MSQTRKVAGIGLLAVVVTSGFAVMNASATVTGHFVHHAIDPHAFVTGTENGTHRTKIRSGGGTWVECDITHYHGTLTTHTVTKVKLRRTSSQCHTEGGAPGSVVVDENECTFDFDSRTTGHATVTLACPAGVAGIVTTHPNCTMRMPPQALSGATYGAVTEGGVQKITLNLTIPNITMHYEGGICVFLGTTHSAEMVGSATLGLFNTAGLPISGTTT